MFFKLINSALIFSFIVSSLYMPEAQAGEIMMPPMPTPGTMVYLSPAFEPARLVGMTIHPDNALKFDFLVNRGDEHLTPAQEQQEYKKLVKYFMATLTIPNKDQWVNLSPYEHNRIIQDNFGKTELGRELLAQDYLLKQITSSLMYPESGLGKKFWDEVYRKVYQEFGIANVPVNTFNKVWIMPDEATVYESGNTVYVIHSHLKVMLEEDYLSLSHHVIPAKAPTLDGAPPKAVAGIQNTTHTVANNIIRQIILPALEKEVNEGKNFAKLRQIVSSMVLSTWYKKALKESLLGKIYADRDKIKNLSSPNALIGDPQYIYQQYLKAFKKGVYNYIKEDEDKYTHHALPRKYFAGGMEGVEELTVIKGNLAMLSSRNRKAFINIFSGFASLVSIAVAVVVPMVPSAAVAVSDTSDREPSYNITVPGAGHFVQLFKTRVFEIPGESQIKDAIRLFESLKNRPEYSSLFNSIEIRHEMIDRSNYTYVEFKGPDNNSSVIIRYDSDRHNFITGSIGRLIDGDFVVITPKGDYYLLSNNNGGTVTELNELENRLSLKSYEQVVAEASLKLTIYNINKGAAWRDNHKGGIYPATIYGPGLLSLWTDNLGYNNVHIPFVTDLMTKDGGNTLIITHLVSAPNGHILLQVDTYSIRSMYGYFKSNPDGTSILPGPAAAQPASEATGVDSWGRPLFNDELWGTVPSSELAFPPIADTRPLNAQQVRELGANLFLNKESLKSYGVEFVNDDSELRFAGEMFLNDEGGFYDRYCSKDRLKKLIIDSGLRGKDLQALVTVFTRDIIKFTRLSADSFSISDNSILQRNIDNLKKGFSVAMNEFDVDTRKNISKYFRDHEAEIQTVLKDNHTGDDLLRMSDGTYILRTNGYVLRIRFKRTGEIDRIELTKGTLRLMNPDEINAAAGKINPLLARAGIRISPGGWGVLHIEGEGVKSPENVQRVMGVSYLGSDMLLVSTLSYSGIPQFESVKIGEFQGIYKIMINEAKIPLASLTLSNNTLSDLNIASPNSFLYTLPSMAPLSLRDLNARIEQVKRNLPKGGHFKVMGQDPFELVLQIHRGQNTISLIDNPVNIHVDKNGDIFVLTVARDQPYLFDIIYFKDKDYTAKGSASEYLSGKNLPAWLKNALGALGVRYRDRAMLFNPSGLVEPARNGGISLNADNMNLIDVKRDGHGVPLPVNEQDMAQLAHIPGFDIQILGIKPVTSASLPVLSELVSHPASR